MNDLLGAKEPRENETLAHLPKAEAGRFGRAPEKFHPDISEAAVSVTASCHNQSPFPKPANVTHAMCERARQT